MKKHPAHIDPDLPKGLGDALGCIDHADSFIVPQDYFETLKSELDLKVLRSEPNTDEEFFHVQAAEIRLKAFRQTHEEELLVPDGYFEKGISLGSGGSGSTGKVLNLKWITIPAAAAAIALAIWVLRPQKPELSDFATLLEQTEIEFEDLEYFAETEDIAALYFDSYGDTLIIDSSSVSFDLINDSLIFIQRTAPASTDSVGGRENLLKKQPKISLDELTEDEILEYLLEEGGEDLFDDL